MESETTQDIVFDLLSNSRRRYVLHFLRVKGETIKLTDLADQVASWEYETPIEELSDRERKRAYVSLYQTHVPKLVDAEFIVHDSEGGTLTATDRVQTIDRFLPRERIRWERLYLLLALGGAILFAAGLSSVGLLDTVSRTVTGAVILGSFGVTSVIHFISGGLSGPPMLVDPDMGATN